MVLIAAAHSFDAVFLGKVFKLDKVIAIIGTNCLLNFEAKNQVLVNHITKQPQYDEKNNDIA